jgi:hypothetical protein
VLVGDEELYLPYQEFPWFEAATIRDVMTVEQPSPGHLYWPTLDVDLGLETIRHPERFPLKSRLKKPE